MMSQKSLTNFEKNSCRGISKNLVKQRENKKGKIYTKEKNGKAKRKNK